MQVSVPQQKVIHNFQHWITSVPSQGLMESFWLLLPTKTTCYSCCICVFDSVSFMSCQCRVFFQYLHGFWIHDTDIIFFSAAIFDVSKTPKWDMHQSTNIVHKQFYSSFLGHTWCFCWSFGWVTHRIHGTGIFTYICHILPLKTTIHVGKYTSPMDPMGK